MFKNLQMLVLAGGLLASQAHATTYYVSMSDGDDSHLKAQATSSSTPWKTISKVNSQTFTPGDSILFKRGDTWREMLSPPSSGGPENPVVFDAYGNGPKPQILGSDPVKGWTAEGGNIWQASFGNMPDALFFVKPDGKVSWGLKERLKSDLDAEYDWWYDNPNGTIYVYTTSDPDTAFSAVEAGLRKGIYATGNIDCITIENLEVAYFGDPGGTQSWGIAPSTSSDYWLIQDNEVHHGGHREATEQGDGVKLVAGSHYHVRRNLIYEVGRHGIHINSGNNLSLTNVLIEYNTLHNNYHANIDFNMNNTSIANSDHVARFNTIYGTDDFVDLDGNGQTGFHVKGYSATVVLRRVDIYGNVISNIQGNSGINLNGFEEDIYVCNNSFYHAGNPQNGNGIRVASGSQPIKVFIMNNIIYLSGRQCLNISSQTTGITVDYNIIYNPGGLIAYLHGSDYSNWDSYRSATGFDTHGLSVNTAFNDPGNNDLILLPESQAINAGIDLGSPYNTAFGGTIRPDGKWDIGAFEYRNLSVTGDQIR